MKWISTKNKKKLPFAGNDVLVFTKEGFIYIDRFTKQDGNSPFGWNNHKQSDVLYWMPLPDKPIT